MSKHYEPTHTLDPLCMPVTQSYPGLPKLFCIIRYLDKAILILLLMNQFYLIPSDVRFFKNLHLPRTIQNLKYEFRGSVIIYAIRCQITNMVYLGSTMIPGKRWHDHLVTGKHSNAALQAAILKYGISHFTAYVFERDIKFPAHLSTIHEKLAYLHAIEQTYINRFHQDQLFNAINSSAS
jgi:hypothetical protein